MEPYWHSRGYLPHFECWEAIQFVTFHLADSLPAEALKRLVHETRDAEGDAKYRRRIETYLDAGHGECLLRRPEFAAIVRDALLFFDGERYRLDAWTILPNHAHALFQPLAPHTLGGIVLSWKSFTARRINALLGRQGALWQEEYFDRFVRDEEHFAATTQYIRENPVKAGLASHAEDWPWGSAADGKRE